MTSVTALSNMSAHAIDQLVARAATINISGVSFVTADQANDSRFETSAGLDAFVKALIAERGVAGAIDALKVNGSQADAFKLIWDHLDDNYTSYYNSAVNDAFVDLGIAYAEYLLGGGAALLDIVKYVADDGDAGIEPERRQSLHDNLLGNLDELSIADRFGAGADAILDRIEDAGLGALIGERGDYADGRAIFGGYDSQDDSATRAFDSDYFFA